MKKERSFRPPKAVLSTVDQFDGDPSIVKLDSGSIPLSKLQQMYSFLSAPDIISKGRVWDEQGGNAGLMWSRRVLRQEGIIKGSTLGNVVIPEVIDIQLGPNIIVAFASDNEEELISKFEEAGIPASFIPSDDGTFVFYAGDAQLDYVMEKGLVNLPDVALGDITVVDESRNKMTSIFKVAGENTVDIECAAISGLSHVVEADWGDTFILKALDSPGNQARMIKVDEDLGLVMGWAIICTVDGQPYFDKQDDYIPDHGMLDASLDFMLNSRVAKEMHTGDERGTIVFAWPMTEEIAKAFDIEVHQTGLMIAMKPHSEEILEKFRDGTYSGFSIGGNRITEHTEEVD